jgi:tetratricopeptide (TPR) repeat protein
MLVNKLRIIVFGALVLFNAFMVLGQDQSVDVMLSAAGMKLQSKDYSGAISDYNKILVTSPHNQAALCGKINALFVSGNTKDAYSLVENTISKESSYAGYHYLRGLIQNAREKYEKAIEDFDLAYRLDNESNVFNIYLNRGFAKQKISELQAAKDDYTLAIQTEPRNPIAYHSRGQVNYELENYKEAIEDFSKSIEFNANNPIAYFNLGMAYFKNDDKINACVYFHKASALGNTNARKMIILECSKE